MSFFTLLFVLFTIVLYAYLLVSRKELVFVANYQSRLAIVFPILAAVFVGGLYLVEPPTTLDELIRGIAILATFLSYLIRAKGISEDSFVIHQLDNHGVKFQNIDRVVLFQSDKNAEVKLNFFQFGLRGPLLKFNHPLDDIVLFLSLHLKEGTPIEVVVDQSGS